MVEWLKTHVFIAAWASPILALVGLILRKSSGDSTLNWSRVILYVGFLSGLAILVTPGVEPLVRGAAFSLVAMGFGFLMQDSYRR